MKSLISYITEQQNMYNAKYNDIFNFVYKHEEENINIGIDEILTSSGANLMEEYEDPDFWEELSSIEDELFITISLLNEDNDASITFVVEIDENNWTFSLEDAYLEDLVCELKVKDIMNIIYQTGSQLKMDFKKFDKDKTIKEIAEEIVEMME